MDGLRPGHRAGHVSRREVALFEVGGAVPGMRGLDDLPLGVGLGLGELIWKPPCHDVGCLGEEGRLVGIWSMVYGMWVLSTGSSDVRLDD